MYNQDQKLKFIKDYTQSVPTARSAHQIFKRISALENEINADIVTWSFDVLQTNIEKILSLRKTSWGTALSILQGYSRWCIKNKVPQSNDNIFKIKIESFDKIKRQTVANPLQLQNYFETIFAPVEDNTIDNTFRGLYWMSYAGIKEKSAFNIKSTNVDFVNMTINSNYQCYPIYREAVPLFYNLVNSKSFNHYHPRYKDTIVRSRVPGDILIRGIKSYGNIRTFRTEIKNYERSTQKNSSVNLDLSYKRIWLSGLFYRMAEQERAGINPDFLEAVLYDSDNSNLNSGAIKKMAQRYKEDYERWKLAYNI